MAAPPSPEKLLPLESEEQLFEPFREAEKPKERWLIGTEAEKFGVTMQGAEPLTYGGESLSVRRVLDTLAKDHGWSPQSEFEGGATIALKRGRANITLEPGAQLELSGAPLQNIHQTCQENREHLGELRAISKAMGVVWFGVGFNPFAQQSELDWVPKSRYGVMNQYLPKRGARAWDMMRRTATVQANFDFSSERDAMRKLRVSLKLSPLVTAMFANSPFVEGKVGPHRSERAAVWLEMDPDRTGLLPQLWHEDSSYEDYIQWALDVPMFLLLRGSRIIRNTGQTFRDYMKSGFEGERATMADWESHVNTLFPEARLKSTLEMRCSDSLPVDLVCALPALWAGLLYDEQALSAAESLTGDWQYADLEAVRQAVPRQALGATLLGKPLQTWAERVIELAEGGLERRAYKNPDGDDERIHLARLKSLVAKGQCPADALTEGLQGGGREEVLATLMRLAKLV